MTHHILIASEQLWPNLLGLAALQRRDGGVAGLHIVHSRDPIRSEGPAKRIEAVAGKMLPGTTVHAHVSGSTSQDVFAAVDCIIQGAPSDRWSLNCSGGTKTMFAGLIPYIGRPNVEAFYREVSADWYFLRPAKAVGSQLIKCEEWADARNATVDIPVQELAQLQMEIPAGAEWRYASPPNLDLESFTKSGIAADWNWRTLQRDYPQLSQQQAGFVFEDFFSALVQATGGTNIVKGLKLLEGGQVRHEFDAIVSNGQKIVVFDLKLRNEEDDPVIDQFSRLGEDRRCLGGLGADAIAVRPTWEDKPVNTALAKAHQLTLWTQKDMPRLVERIGQLLQVNAVSPAGTAAKVASQLRDAAGKGKRLFCSAPLAKTPKTDSPMETSIGWLLLDRYISECFALGKAAVVLDNGGRFVVRASCEKTGLRTRAGLAQSMQGLAAIELFKVGASGASFLAVLVSWRAA